MNTNFITLRFIGGHGPFFYSEAPPLRVGRSIKHYERTGLSIVGPEVKIE
jgi:hypothetical protein